MMNWIFCFPSSAPAPSSDQALDCCVSSLLLSKDMDRRQQMIEKQAEYLATLRDKHEERLKRQMDQVQSKHSRAFWGWRVAKRCDSRLEGA